MKTVTSREFYHSSKLVDDLPAGGQLLVTANGKPKFVVCRYGKHPKMTKARAESLAIDAGTSPDFDSSAFLKSLKK